jgi:hypothetical protein
MKHLQMSYHQREKINDPVDLVPFFALPHNMQQSGAAATQYVVVFCYSLILVQQSHKCKKLNINCQ